MSKISLTINVNLQNYAKRIGEISEYMHPTGIEIFSLPQNYQNKLQLKLPEKKDSSTFSLLSEELAKDIGKKLKSHNIRRVQYHYPWQKTLLDMDGHDIALTLQFCDIIRELSDAERFNINYHNVLKYPTKVRESNGNQREEINKMLEYEAIMSQYIKSEFSTPIELIVENNPASFVVLDQKTGQGIVNNADLVAEDYINRRGIEGTTLDYSHAWTVVECFKGNKKYPNIEWCKRQYKRIPNSSLSMESFVRTVSPKIKWIHLSDEADTYSHSGLNIGEGKIDFTECLGLLDKYLREETPATIEVKDAHEAEGFRRIIEKDYPRLLKLIAELKR